MKRASPIRLATVSYTHLDVYKRQDTGIGTADEAGNVLSKDVYKYSEEERSYYALNAAVTADNYKDFTDSTVCLLYTSRCV